MELSQVVTQMGDECVDGGSKREGGKASGNGCKDVDRGQGRDDVPWSAAVCNRWWGLGCMCGDWRDTDAGFVSRVCGGEMEQAHTDFCCDCRCGSSLGCVIGRATGDGSDEVVGRARPEVHT